MELQGGIQQQAAFANPLSSLGSTVLELTNPDDQLNRLELSLRFLVEDRSGVVRHILGPDGVPLPPLLNEYGVISVISTVRSVVSRVTVMSNLEEDEIQMLMVFLADTLARDLMMNRKQYGIVDPTARDKIYFSCLTQAFVCLKRAFKEGDRRFLKGSTQENKTTITQENSGGFASKLLGWGKKS